MVIPRPLTAGRKRGASVTTILHSGASAKGVVDAPGRVFFHGGPSAFATIAHDAHGVSVITAPGASPLAVCPEAIDRSQGLRV